MLRQFVARRDGSRLTKDITREGRPKLLLVDGNSVLFRAFYGVPLLTTASGLYTNAVYGFSMMLLNLIKEEQPTHTAVAFDKGKMTFRHEQFPEYKGKRSATPPELIGQFAMAREILGYFQIPSLELDLYEADDIIGTLAMQGAAQEYEVVLVTGDKDLLQLVGPHVTTCLTRKGTTDLVRYDPAAVRERYTLEPKQIIDLKGLMGDASDNIPGVPGIGEKTAIKLLHQFPTVEEVLAHVEEVSGKKVQERLREFHDQALASKRLATIHCEVPLSVGVEDLAFAGYDMEELRRAFRKFEFRTLIDRLQVWQVQGSKAGRKTKDAQTEQPDLFAAQDEVSEGVQETPLAFAGEEAGAASADPVVRSGAEDEAGQLPPIADLTEPQIEQDWLQSTLITLPIGELATRLGDVRESASVLLDLDGDYQTGQLRGIVVVTGQVAYYGVWPQVGEQPPSADCLTALATFLRHPGAAKILFDYKALLVRMALSGVLPDPHDSCAPAFDALLVTYLLFASEGEPNLADVVTRALPASEVPEDARLALDKGGDLRPRALAYCGRLLLQAQPWLEEQLRAQSLTGLYENVELPLSRVLAELELYGVRLNTDRLHVIGDELAQGITRLTARIYDIAGQTFNINSTKQLGEILFDKMGLTPIKKTKTGYSTSADVLEKLAPQSELVTEILQYRQLAKLQSTYVEGLLSVVRMPDSRVHTSFHQAIAATGRLSSKDPNLQNIPIRLEEGRRLRQAFVPTYENWAILSADYSQVELRILAHLSQDPALMEAFRLDMDIHTRTASDVFEVAVDDVTALMRRQAKAVNFGIIYGISDYGLSQNLNISRAQAGRFIEQYFEKFPGVKGYMDESVERARELGYAETVLGRRRYLPGIRSRNFNERSFAERTAMNTPIQGTAADIIKKAMVELSETLRGSGLQAKMLLQVHDELIFEFPREEHTMLMEMVRTAMENAVLLSVPLRVDINIGDTWYDAK